MCLIVLLVQVLLELVCNNSLLLLSLSVANLEICRFLTALFSSLCLRLAVYLVSPCSEVVRYLLILLYHSETEGEEPALHAVVKTLNSLVMFYGFFFSVPFIRVLNTVCLFECFWTLRWYFNLQHNIYGDCLWLVFNGTQHQFCCPRKRGAHCHVPFHHGLGGGRSLISYCNTWQSKLGEDSCSWISALHFFLWLNWGHWSSGVEDIYNLRLKKK